MRVSIIIPCYRAENTIMRAVSSIMAQQKPSCDIQVVVAADDAGDYSAVRAICPDIVFVPPMQGYDGTGPGATRNRGINASSGDVLAFLDADDAWSEDYLPQLLPLALKHGAAFAQTEIYGYGQLQDGPPLLTLGPQQLYLRPSDFGHWPGSFHPCMMRQLALGFDHGAGQDVFHALEVLGLVGGRAPIASSARYRLNLQGDSATADPSFGRRIDTRYRQRIRAYKAGQTHLMGMARHQAVQALYRRMVWNRLWSANGQHHDGFYGFVAAQKNKRKG